MLAFAVLVLYLLATALLAAGPRTPPVVRLVLPWLAALLHAAALAAHSVALGAYDAELFQVLSQSAWLMVLILLVDARRDPALLTPGMVIFPGAALWVGLAAWTPVGAAPLALGGTGVIVHVISSLLAFGLLANCTVLALVTAAQEHVLRRHQARPWMQSLPPLIRLERLLFRLLAAGWLALTAALGSGLLFVHDLFAQHLVHKTILSFVAWLVFAGLLFGRWRYGWRGRTAVRLTLAGMLFLLLAYFGSKFVLELLLDRSWQITSAPNFLLR